MPIEKALTRKKKGASKTSSLNRKKFDTHTHWGNKLFAKSCIGRFASGSHPSLPGNDYQDEDALLSQIVNGLLLRLLGNG